MILRKTVLVILALIALSLLACGDRDNPADPSAVSQGLVFRYDRRFNTQELIADGDPNWVNFRTRAIRIYTPPGYVYDPPGEGAKFPTLYLLHDFLSYPDSGLAFLYSRIDLIADRLIASGEIKPMVIVMPDVSTPVGGSFLADGWSLWDADPFADKNRAGEFEKMIYRDLIRIMETDAYTPPDSTPFSIIKKRASRAIGGIGMGGYGALKIALRHPELFSSVSMVNGFSAVAESIGDLADSVFSEIGVQEGDSAGFIASFDTSFSRPYTALLVSMAAAFSPHDSLGPDGRTFVQKFGIDLPFDFNGQTEQSVVNRWLSKDLTATLLDQYGVVLDSTALYFSAGVDDQYGAAAQATAFKQKLDQLGAEYESATFSGYSGYPAYRGSFNADQLIEVLKFHSRHLSDEP
jgi:S-formylglutathione hydrolase FrmB